ncbi:MAG: hypothetical protein KDB27_14740, partial [Planctomycetales bacterium]|nr:hypothetical protein [Planctomycetales bacterium]
MRCWRFRFLALGLSVVLGASATATEFNLDFETDPADLEVEFHGTSEWRGSDGFDDSGYLSVTDALNGQRGSIVFPDLANGESLKAFRITADLRVGGGTSSPADGFSFNFARPGDPVLDDGEGWASSPTNEANLPEEGTTTGLAIGFDEWYSGGRDVIGMSIRIDNELVDQAAFPKLNGTVDDDQSLQTVLEDGITGVFDDELQDQMGWARLEMELCANNLTVSYKGREVFNRTVEYAPSPGQLVFGGRTGDANSYHHIDNISIATNEDVGAGCVIIPRAQIDSDSEPGVIGKRVIDGSKSNLMFGPEQDGAPGWSARMIDPEGETIDNHTYAEELLDDLDGVTASYDFIDLGGGGGTFPDTQPYPTGISDESQEDFAVRAEAKVTIPAGSWTIGFATDDGGQLTIPGVEFGDSQANDSVDAEQIRFEGNRGHAWTVGSFELDAPLETTITASMHERGGGDSFEIAVLNDSVVEDASPATGWELLGNGTFGWEVTHTGTPLVSGDIDGEVRIGLDIQFDVNGDTNEADQIVLENPNANIYTTKLDVDGQTFFIAPTGAIASGDSFRIIDADVITGTPIITSDDGRNWVFDAATGNVCVDSCAGGVAGDYNGNGMRDAGDLDLQAAAIGGNDAQFDLNGDGSVNFADRQQWLEGLSNTFIGDWNFDGQFNSSDFVAVFTTAKYETGAAATFAEGDSNGDGLFNSSDFVVAFTGGGYEGGARAGGLQVVPE